MFDIANVEVADSCRGQGHFKAFLETVKDVCKRYDLDAIYVETVLTERFASHFRKHGWIETPGRPPSFFFVITC